MPSIDVVIVNYRGAADTLQALDRLAGWRWGTVWLVDNSAHEPDMADEAQALQQATTGRPWLRLRVPGANLGFGRASNLAFAESQADYFLLLNPDARIAVDEVLLLTQEMERNPKLGAVSPKIYWNEARTFVLPAPFAQTPWHSVALALLTHSTRLARWAAHRALQQASTQMASTDAFEVDFLAGAVMLLRRSAMLTAGGLFDPDYFMFFEDSDLSLRLRRAGYALAMLPQVGAVHEYRHKEFKAGLMAQSQGQYFSKQYPRFFRWSGQLTRVAALARAVPVEAWFGQTAPELSSAQAFADWTGGAGGLAFSPSVLMLPALFRPQGVAVRSFDAHEWTLLEPAAYTALLAGDAGSTRWVYFRKV